MVAYREESVMLLTLLLACDDPAPGTPADSGDAPGTGETPTYYRDVKPVLDRTCARCHNAAGIATDFSDPAYVQALAPTIAARTAAGEMPPPAPDPACRDYEDSDRMVLGAADKATLAAWSDAGAPLGDAAAASTEPEVPTLAPFDITLSQEEAYIPDFAADGNDYRCYLLDVGNEEELWVTGVEPIIGNPKIVHHLVLYQVHGDVEVSDAPGGFACGGLGGDGWDFWVGWAPGGGPLAVPEGSAMYLPPRSRLVLNMHYYGDGTRAGESDLSGYGFTTQPDRPERGTIVYPLGDQRFTIPANDADYDVTSSFTWREDYGIFHVQGVFPHMHLLGRNFTMSAADDCMVDATPWDFHNQVTSFFTEEVVFDAGDKVSLTCNYDNSADSPYQYNDPPQDVAFGEESTAEMCYAFTYGWFE
jgi:hypothetical protein